MIGGVCFHVLIPAAAGVLQDPSDASLFSISSWQQREICNRAAGEFGHQLTEMFGACKAPSGSRLWCQLHVQQGCSIQASPDEDLCCGYPRLMPLLHDVKGTQSFSSPKTWRESVVYNKESDVAATLQQVSAVAL